MKTIILSGGLGKRLRPATAIYNKHLAIVYNKPVIFYPLSLMIEAGAEEFGIVAPEEQFHQLRAVLSSGEQWRVSIQYIPQPKPAGIADGIKRAAHFINGEPCTVILGDNLFLGEELPHLVESAWKSIHSTIFLRSVQDPSHYGVATLVDDKLVHLEEKPSKPESNLAITGLYIYDSELIPTIANLNPSLRGELEITSVNRAYLAKESLDYVLLSSTSPWFDGGKPTTLLGAAQQVSRLEALRGYPVGCPFYSAWKVGKITKTETLRAAEYLRGSDYHSLLVSAIAIP